jgi:uncharacterized membrane protein YgdD (TMEM256/DUF423 family)
LSFATSAVLLLGGLFGASGVALAAAASHGAFPNAAPASQMLLAHAPAMLTLALWPASGRFRPLPLVVGAGLIGIGVLLFAGSLVLRGATGIVAFGMAAPMGGILTIGGWLAIAAAALTRRSRAIG